MSKSKKMQQAFTMVEIAISLAVIGFALLAIIGILPLGMNVQKNNREETIIDQDANVLMDAIRNGAQGFDDLTNYVISITNAWTSYDIRGSVPRRTGQGLNWYTPTRSSVKNPEFPLSSGLRIIGLLSTPRFIWSTNKGSISFLSNYVAASFRSISGPASEKFPQTNPDVIDLGLSYRLYPEILTYGSSVSDVVTNAGWDLAWSDYGSISTNSPQFKGRVDYALYASSLRRNLHDIRLVFRWPLLPNGTVPAKAQRQVFRTMMSGSILYTNDYTMPNGSMYPLFFLKPSVFSPDSL